MLVGLTGPAYAGKSAVANALNERLGGGHMIQPFAKPLKDMARMFGWDGKKDDKGRRFLQFLGTEIGRCYNNDFWVDQWAGAIVAVNGSICNAIADDARFENEVGIIRREGGLLVCVTASEETRSRRAEVKGEKLPPPHPSENWQSLKTDLTVWNEDCSLGKVVDEIIRCASERGIKIG